MLSRIFRFLVVAFLVCAFQVARGQTFERSFRGHWASTLWEFAFHIDSTYERASFGHYGHTLVEGRYERTGDTIHLLSGYENTSQTVNEYYLLDSNGYLIDLSLRYDYAPVTATATKPDSELTRWSYPSRVRRVKYPQTDDPDPRKRAELETVLQMALNSPSIRKYYHFDQFPKRRLVIASYYHLKADTLSVDSHTVIFLPKEQIRDAFFIEIEDLNQNRDKIEIDLILHGEGVSLWFYFVKREGVWIEGDVYETEN